MLTQQPLFISHVLESLFHTDYIFNSTYYILLHSSLNKQKAWKEGNRIYY